MKWYLNNSYIFQAPWLINLKNGDSFAVKKPLSNLLNNITSNGHSTDKKLLTLLKKNKIITTTNPSENWHPDYVNLYFELETTCNLSCRYCFNRKAIREKSLTIDDWLNIATFFPVNTKLTIFGGEPFLYKELCILIRELTKKFKELILFTNGTVNREDVLESLSQLNNITLKVSLDGLESGHDFIRGKGNFNKTISFIKTIKEKTSCKVIVKSLKNKFNLNELINLIPILADLRVDEFGLGDIILYGNSKELTNERPSFQEAFTFWQKILEKASEYNITILDFNEKEPLVNLCGCGYNLIYIRSDGKISGCTMLADRYFTKLTTHDLIKKFNENITPETAIIFLPNEFKSLMYLSPICQNCNIVNICKGGCRGRACIEYGSIEKCDEYRKQMTYCILKTLLK